MSKLNWHFDPFQYLHHFIFRIESNVWIQCGIYNHLRIVRTDSPGSEDAPRRYSIQREDLPYAFTATSEIPSLFSSV